MPSDSEFVRFVRREMERLGYNQADLAARAGISKPTVSLMLTGKRTPDALTCQKLAHALGCDPQYLQQLAGHDVPKREAQTLESSLRNAIVPYLSAEASSEVIEEMVATCLREIQDIGFKYHVLQDDALTQARARLDARDFDYRAVDPLTRRVLTAVFQSGQAFYVTGQLIDAGDERHRTAISQTLYRPDWFPIERQFPLRVWPQAMYASGIGLVLEGHNPYAIHFWIPEYGDVGRAWQFRIVYPDGSEIEIQDRLIYEVQLQLSRRAAEALPDTAGRTTELEQAYVEDLAKKEADIWSGLALRRPERVAINPDTQSYLVLLAQLKEAGTYWIQEGRLADMAGPRWNKDVLEKHTPQRRQVDEQGDWSSLIHLGGYCLNILTADPDLQHYLGGRKYNPSPHFVLSWEEHDDRFFGIASLGMGTWRVLQVRTKGDEFLGVDIVEEEVESGVYDDRRAALEELVREKVKNLRKQHLGYRVLPTNREAISAAVWDAVEGQ